MKKLSLLVLGLLLGVQGVSLAQAEEQARNLIIGFRKGVSAEKQEAVLKRFGLDSVDTIDGLNVQVAKSAPGKFRPSSVRLMSDPDIFYVEEDFYTNWLNNSAASFQSRPLPRLGAVMGQLPKFESKRVTGQGEMPWGVVRVGASKAWERGVTGAGVRVAIVDTGVDFKHPDLAANYKGGYNAIDSDKPAMDDHGHGTHVAGTIAAVADGEGVVGVAPLASIYAVKVLDAKGGGSLTSIIKGVVWCANNNIQIANMSLGSPMGSLFMRLAVSYAKSRGVVIIAAAGNSGGSVGYPAAYDSTIAISASDASDALAGFSSRGKEVDFVAPGVDVKSTLPGGKYGSFSGTSMATPHVAGLAALAISQGASGMDGVKTMLKGAAQPIDGLAGKEQGNGMINAGGIRRR
jgi:subtilisin family serine protease